MALDHDLVPDPEGDGIGGSTSAGRHFLAACMHTKKCVVWTRCWHTAKVEICQQKWGRKDAYHLPLVMDLWLCNKDVQHRLDLW